MKGIRITLIVILLGMLACSLAWAQEPDKQEESKYAHVKVVDVLAYDLIKLESGEIVRLIGLSCPAQYEGTRLVRYILRTRMDYNTLMELGEETKKFTRDLVLNKKVTLEFDQKKKDAFGQLLAYVWFEVAPDSHIQYIEWPPYYETGFMENEGGHLGIFVFLNATIIKAGFANPAQMEPNTKHDSLLTEAYYDALDNKRALY